MMNRKIEIRYSKFKLLKSLIVGISLPIIVAIPVMMSSSSNPPPPFLIGSIIICTLFFGYCSLNALKKLLSKQPALIIDDRGVVVEKNFIPWSDVIQIEISDKQFSKTKTQYLVIHLKNPDKYIQNQSGKLKQKIMLSNYKLIGSPVSIPNKILKIKLDELKTILDTQFSKYCNDYKLLQSKNLNEGDGLLGSSRKNIIKWEHTVTKKDYSYIKNKYFGTVFGIIGLLFFGIFTIDSTFQNLAWLSGPYHNTYLITLLFLSIIGSGIYILRSGDSPVTKLLKKLPAKFITSVQLVDDGFIVQMNDGVSPKFFYKDISEISVNDLYIRIEMQNRINVTLIFSTTDQGSTPREQLIEQLKRKITKQPKVKKIQILRFEIVSKAIFIIIFGAYFAAINITSLVVYAKEPVPEWEKSVAFFTLKTKANFGSAKAQNNLGVLYMEGKLGPVDKDKAKYWFEKSAAQNYRLASRNLQLLD